MKTIFNLKYLSPDLRSILYETGFIAVYAIVVLFIFQPFGTHEHIHPFKLAQLSGYILIILLCFPVIKKVLLVTLLKDGQYSVKQEMLILLICLFVISFIAFLYHGLAINEELKWNHLPAFLLYGAAFWLLPFCGIIYNKWIKVKHYNPIQITSQSGVDKLEIKGNNLSENFHFNSSDIFYLKSNGNYVLIYFEKDGKLKHEMIRNTLNQICEQLNSARFSAIHRSFIANTKMFDKLIREDGKHILINQKFDIRLPVSRNKVSDLEKMMKDYS